jgi:putative MFS transporter
LRRLAPMRRRWWPPSRAKGSALPIRWACTLVLSAASLVACALGAYLSDAIGRRPSIIGASVVTIVFSLATSMPGVYRTELFPTEIRLRANGICNTLGRGATVVSPFIVGSLMTSYSCRAWSG